MSLLPFTIIFFLGGCIGSFSAVLLENSSPDRSFWTGRSLCFGCKKPLAWYELIPLVSYTLQKGKCRLCRSVIPAWIWYMEWYMAFLWMIAAMVLTLEGLSPLSVAIHIIILTGLSLLVIEDMRSRMISDKRSMPLIAIIFAIFVFLAYVPMPTLLPETSYAILGAFFGMMFYMVQMIVPAASEVIHRRKYEQLFDIFMAPFVFPLWMLVKAFFGEKKADRLFPSLQVFDSLPTWVGGGDIRLGLIVGAIVGPYNFLYVIMYGYSLGTLYFLLKLYIFREKMETMPVAPLLFFGVCVVWWLRIFL